MLLIAWIDADDHDADDGGDTAEAHATYDHDVDAEAEASDHDGGDLGLGVVQ